MKGNKNVVDLKIGDVIPIETLTTITGSTHKLKNNAAGGIVHLYFGRFSGCPVCNFHYRKYSEMINEIEAKGITTLFILHSTKIIIEQNQGTSPWSKDLNWVADPKKNYYIAVGAEPSRKWVLTSIWATIVNSIKGKKEAIYGLKYDNEDLMQQPMEILLNSKDGKILAIKKAKTLTDRWFPEDVLRYKDKIVGK